MKCERSDSWMLGNAQPMPFEALTKLDGPVYRHLEQLWDEIKRLKTRVSELEKKNNLYHKSQE